MYTSASRLHIKIYCYNIKVFIPNPDARYALHFRASARTSTLFTGLNRQKKKEPSFKFLLLKTI